MKLKTELKQFRKRTGLSQPAAAKHLGVPVQTLRDWEQGACEPRPLAAEALRARLKTAR